MEVAGRCARLAQARHSESVVRAEYEQRREAVLEVVRAQLEALDSEFGELIHAAKDAVAQCEAEVREAVLQVGESVKQEGIHAVFVRGRVSWDSEALSRYAETHPEVKDFRSVGAPSVSIRYKPAELS